MKEVLKDNHPYNDIINLPHHSSKKHGQMSIHDRAAQFSPFAAVTGYDEAIKETARLTEEKVELDENAKTLLNEKFRIVREQLNKNLEIELVYFKADSLKSGGSYYTIVGSVKKIKEYENLLVMKDGTRIPIEDILDMKGDMFHVLEDFFA